MTARADEILSAIGTCGGYGYTRSSRGAGSLCELTARDARELLASGSRSAARLQRSRIARTGLPPRRRGRGRHHPGRAAFGGADPGQPDRPRVGTRGLADAPRQQAFHALNTLTGCRAHHPPRPRYRPPRHPAPAQPGGVLWLPDEPDSPQPGHARAQHDQDQREAARHPERIAPRAPRAARPSTVARCAAGSPRSGSRQPARSGTALRRRDRRSSVDR